MILEVNNITKIYSKSKKNKGGALTALDNVSFSLDKGEILGLVGPNGAGKSTLIKCITGLATQTSGEIKIDGYDTRRQHVESIKKVGAIIENPDLYKDMSALDNLVYLVSISEVEGCQTKADRIARAETLLKTVNLFDRRKDKVAKYSLGMKQRLGIAQALIAKPELLILDEPANGLDPEGVKEMRDIIIHLAHDLGMAILISSHLLSELQLTCDRFIIIKNGRLLKDVKASELVVESNLVVAEVDDVLKARDVLREELSLECTQTGDGRLEIKTDMTSGEIAKVLVLNNVIVKGISVKERSLEELFMSVTNPDNTEGNDVR